MAGNSPRCIWAARLTREVAEDENFQTAMWLSMALYLPLSLLFWPHTAAWAQAFWTLALSRKDADCQRRQGPLPGRRQP